MRNKQYRRFQEKKKKHWAKKLLELFFRDIPYIITDKEIGKRAHTPQPCSCAVCGNPRHHFKKKKDKLTVQEQKANDKFIYRDDTYFEEM